MVTLQCCGDVTQDLFTSELTDDVAMRLAALHIVQRYHDDSSSSSSSRCQRRLTVRNVQLVMQRDDCHIVIRCDRLRLNSSNQRGLRHVHRRQSVGDGGTWSPQYFAGGDGPPNNFCLRIFDTSTIVGLIIQANA